MKKLIICGKGNDHIPLSQIRERDTKVWLHGTDPRDGADWYFELHGIDTGGGLHCRLSECKRNKGQMGRRAPG